MVSVGCVDDQPSLYQMIQKETLSRHDGEKKFTGPFLPQIDLSTSAKSQWMHLSGFLSHDRWTTKRLTTRVDMLCFSGYDCMDHQQMPKPLARLEHYRRARNKLYHMLLQLGEGPVDVPLLQVHPIFQFLNMQG